MAVSTAIYNVIRANANCLSTFATRIYPLEIPLVEGTRWPCITYRLNSVEPTNSQEHTKQWDECNVTLTVFAETYTACETYCGYVRTAIDHYRGATGSETVKETYFIGMADNDIFNIGQGDSDTTGIGLFSRDITFSMVTTA